MGVPIMYGRDSDVRRFRSVLSAPHQPTLVEVTGEPGIGKTRLLGEFHRAGVDAGWHVVPAVADEWGDDIACDLMLQVHRHQPSGDAHLDLSGLSRSDLFRSVRDGLSAAAACHAGVLLLLDDLHWADAASIAMLGRLLREPLVPNIVVVVAYRSRQTGRELAGALAAAGNLHRSRHALTGLSVADVGRLVGAPDAAASARVHTWSGGNPLYAMALADGPPARPDDQTSEEQVPAGPVRTDIAQALLAETATLSTDAWAALQVASALGERCEAKLLSTIIGDDGPIDVLVARDLLRYDTYEATLLEFRHSVLRSVVYGSILPGPRRDLHARVAVAMKRHGLPASRYAGHVARGARPGDIASVHLLLSAAVEVAATAPAAAASWLTAARDLAPDDPDLHCDIELARADAHVGVGSLDDGRAVLERLESRHASPDRRARHAIARAAVHRLLGQPATAMALVRAEAATADMDDTALAAALHLEGAICATICGSPDYRDLLDRAATSLATADAARTADLRQAHAIVSVFASAYFGPTPDTLTQLDAASATIDALSDRDIAQVLSPLGLLAWAEVLFERDSRAIPHFDRAITVAERSHQVHLVPYLLVGRCFALSRMGRLTEALTAAADADDLARSLGVPSLIGLVGSFRASIVAWQSGPAAGCAVAEATTEVVRPGGRDWFAEVARRVHVYLRFQAGRLIDGVNALTFVSGGTGLPWLEATTRPFWLVRLAEMHLAAGRIDEATACVTEAESIADRYHLRGQVAHAKLASAMLTLATGDPDLAATLASAAAQDFASLGWPLDEGSARAVAARACAAADRPSDAWAELARVREIAAETGAGALLQAAVNGQRSVGASGPRPAPAETALTRREERIVDLVRRGCNNKEIALRLAVTTKTIESHLTRIFRKFGVASRTQLLAATGQHAPSG